jgi:hypothetical protein
VRWKTLKIAAFLGYMGAFNRADVVAKSLRAVPRPLNAVRPFPGISAQAVVLPSPPTSYSKRAR